MAMTSDIHQNVLDTLRENGVADYIVERIDSVLESHGRRLQDAELTPSNPDYGLNIALVLICLLCAALASGLTQGLLSLDYMEMKIKSESGTVEEKKNATRVLPIIVKHHLLLVTLMLWNATAMEALPIFLDKLVPEWLAIVLSVSLILIVGEIVPAAILTGPKQLELAALAVPLVYMVMMLFFPIAYPISVALDRLLGHDEGITQYNRREMATLVRLQHEEVTRGGGQGDEHDMHMDEVAIIEGALTFRTLQVSSVMTPIVDTFMLGAHERLNYKTLAEIFKAGYSRIPVWETSKNDIIGLILVKDLIFVDPEDDTPLKSFVQLFGRQPTLVWSDDSLGVALSGFRQKQAHMALVREIVDSGDGLDSTYRTCGIITLEDIIETILGTEIEDEHDADEARADGMSKSQLRDFDMARLKLLNSKMSDASNLLCEDEVKAVAAHLLANVHQVQQLFGNNMEAVRELVRRGMLIELRRKSDHALKPSPEDILYRKGVPTSFCTLILSGKITVVTGRDNFSIDLGPWSIIAADCLVMMQSQYFPDFVAYIASDSVRAVRLSIFSDAACQPINGLRFTVLDARKAELGLVSTAGARKDRSKAASGLDNNNHGNQTSSAHARGVSPPPDRGRARGALAAEGALASAIETKYHPETKNHPETKKHPESKNHPLLPPSRRVSKPKTNPDATTTAADTAVDADAVEPLYNVSLLELGGMDV